MYYIVLYVICTLFLESLKGKKCRVFDEKYVVIEHGYRLCSPLIAPSTCVFKTLSNVVQSSL